MISLVHTPWPRDARYLQIGDLLVDLHCRRVLHAGAEIELPQRIFDLLLLLLAEPHALHSRSELFERLWPGVIVEDANLSQSVWLLRRALGEECKDWIRTVPGAGYVFEPPSPVESFIDRPVSAPSANLTDAEGASKASAPPPSDEPAMPAPRMDNGAQPERSGWLRSWGGLSVAAALVISLTLGVASYDKRRDKLAPAEVVPLTVAVIEVGDPANDFHWPVALLRDWLAWKLGSLPEVTLLTESDLAADTSATAPIVVFLSAGSDSEDPDDIVLRARFQQAAEEQRIEMRGAAEEVPVMADKLSREIVKRLSPGRTEPWPAMELNAAAARRYANVAAAVERRDWITAATLSDEVVKLAPRFGLVRLQQARAQSALAQAPEAIDSMDKARALLLPAPSDVTALLDAQRLALNPDPRSQQEAVAAYAALVARHPGNSSMALKHAALLIQTLDTAQALKLLTSHRWDREATGVRIQRLLVLAAAYRAQGDTERAVQSAHTAERLAHAAGKGWNLKRAEALLQMAVLDRGPDQERRVALFKQAAALFDDERESHGCAVCALPGRGVQRANPWSWPAPGHPALPSACRRLPQS